MQPTRLLVLVQQEVSHVDRARFRPARPLLQVSLLIRRELFERAKDFSIILDDVAITELSFSREYTAAVEAKQVGEWTGTGPLPQAQQARLDLRFWLFSSSPAGGAAGPVLRGEGQAGAEAEDHPG